MTDFNIKVKVRGGDILEQRMDGYNVAWDAFERMLAIHKIYAGNLDWFHCDEIPVEEPQFNARDILSEIAGTTFADSRFGVMSSLDYEAYAGATPGSLICYDWDGWTVIVSPDGMIDVHAYRYMPDGDGPFQSYRLGEHGWEEL